MISKNIYLLRHLPTENNGKEVITGDLDVPILKNSRIKQKKPLGTKSILTFSSPLIRCQATLEKLNITSNIFYCDLLKERNLGEWQGKQRKSVIQDYPQYFNKGKLIPTQTPPRGESYENFRNRCSKIWDTINHYQNDILICSHNQVLKMIIIIAFELNANKIWPALNLKNGKLINLKKFAKIKGLIGP